jgi:hypothetical protein
MGKTKMTTKAPTLTTSKNQLAWQILVNHPGFFALGKYFYLGMNLPEMWRPLIKYFIEDCMYTHALGA